MWRVSTTLDVGVLGTGGATSVAFYAPMVLQGPMNNVHVTGQREVEIIMDRFSSPDEVKELDLEKDFQSKRISARSAGER